MPVTGLPVLLPSLFVQFVLYWFNPSGPSSQALCMILHNNDFDISTFPLAVPNILRLTHLGTVLLVNCFN